MKIEINFIKILSEYTIIEILKVFKEYSHTNFVVLEVILHLYPEELNVEIIYKNNKVITESEFSLQFHVIDHGLVESIPTGVMISEINLYNAQKLFVNDASLAVITFQLLVEKLSMLLLTLTPVEDIYIIYSGPIIHEQFRVKNFQRTLIIPSFQSTIVIYTKNTSAQDRMKFFAIRKPAMEEINLEMGNEISASFPNTKYHNTYGTLCIIKVSLLNTMLQHKFIMYIISMSLEYDLLRMEYHMDSTHHVLQTGSSIQSGLTEHRNTSLHFSLFISAFSIFGNLLFSLKANIPLSSGAISVRL